MELGSDSTSYLIVILWLVGVYHIFKVQSRLWVHFSQHSKIWCWLMAGHLYESSWRRQKDSANQGRKSCWSACGYCWWFGTIWRNLDWVSGIPLLWHLTLLDTLVNHCLRYHLKSMLHHLFGLVPELLHTNCVFNRLWAAKNSFHLNIILFMPQYNFCTQF